MSAHIFSDLKNCSSGLTYSKKTITRIEQAVKESGMHRKKTTAHRFPNGAYSLCIILAESHIAIHTWPENEAANVDVFLCDFTGDNDRKAELLFDKIAAIFNTPKKPARKIIKRTP